MNKIPTYGSTALFSNKTNPQKVKIYFVSFRRYLEDRIELEETSDDYNLFGNKIEISVSDAVLLPNVVIKEYENNLFVFFATTSSVHQLVLKHPNHQKYVSSFSVGAMFF